MQFRLGTFVSFHSPVGQPYPDQRWADSSWPFWDKDDQSTELLGPWWWWCTNDRCVYMIL